MKVNTAALTKLMEASSLDSKRTKGKSVLHPYNFIERGDNAKKVGLGEMSANEYYLALRRLSEAPECPEEWKKPLLRHERDIFEMAIDWEWKTCRSWSEGIFRAFERGDLPTHWEDYASIKDLQRDAKAKQTADLVRSAPVKRDNHHTTFQSTYNKETDGVPCSRWNSGECNEEAPHGTMPKLFLHICGWCANCRKRQHAHREPDCIKKRENEARKQQEKQDKDF